MTLTWLLLAFQLRVGELSRPTKLLSPPTKALYLPQWTDENDNVPLEHWLPNVKNKLALIREMPRTISVHQGMLKWRAPLEREWRKQDYLLVPLPCQSLLVLMLSTLWKLHCQPHQWTCPFHCQHYHACSCCRISPTGYPLAGYPLHHGHHQLWATHLYCELASKTSHRDLKDPTSSWFQSLMYFICSANSSKGTTSPTRHVATLKITALSSSTTGWSKVQVALVHLPRW